MTSNGVSFISSRHVKDTRELRAHVFPLRHIAKKNIYIYIYPKYIFLHLIPGIIVTKVVNTALYL